MESGKFLGANSRNRQTKMKFNEVGAPLWVIKRELLNKRIATTHKNCFYILRNLEVKQFSRVDGVTFKRVCPQWELIYIPDDIMLSEYGKQQRAAYLEIPLVEGVVFRY